MKKFNKKITVIETPQNHGIIKKIWYTKSVYYSKIQSTQNEGKQGNDSWKWKNKTGIGIYKGRRSGNDSGHAQYVSDPGTFL